MPFPDRRQKGSLCVVPKAKRKPRKREPLKCCFVKVFASTTSPVTEPWWTGKGKILSMELRVPGSLPDCLTARCWDAELVE